MSAFRSNATDLQGEVIGDSDSGHDHVLRWHCRVVRLHKVAMVLKGKGLANSVGQCPVWLSDSSSTWMVHELNGFLVGSLELQNFKSHQYWVTQWTDPPVAEIARYTPIESCLVNAGKRCSLCSSTMTNTPTLKGIHPATQQTTCRKFHVFAKSDPSSGLSATRTTGDISEGMGDLISEKTPGIVGSPTWRRVHEEKETVVMFVEWSSSLRGVHECARSPHQSEPAYTGKLTQLLTLRNETENAQPTSCQIRQYREMRRHPVFSDYPATCNMNDKGPLRNSLQAK
ncbi:hypothetical protein BU15DRAFT_63274 [Melanogaster broomeanus]|nr:hypothetical protein BU15DRAFT_63274 [Melanogaster broomeanus]